MGTARSRLARVAAASILGATLLGVSAGSAFAAQSWQTELTGDQVVPGPGDADGFGIGILDVVDPGTGDLCWTVNVEDVDEVSGLQIFHGAAGAAGTLVYDLNLTLDADGRYKDCWSGQDPTTLQDILDNTADYFLQVNTTAYEFGAIRGQLEATEAVPSVSLGVVLCPVGIETLEEARAAGAGLGPSEDGEWNICAPTYPVGFTPTITPGYHWLVEPIETDLDLRIQPDGWTERIVTDAHFLFGNGVCDPSELWCTSAGWFDWPAIPAGGVALVQEVVPDGYQLGWVRAVVDGVVVDVASANSVPMTLDPGVNEVSLFFFDIVPAPGTTEPPGGTEPPVGSEPPGGTEAPGATGVPGATPAPTTLHLTPPPTSTIARGGTSDAPEALGAALFLLTSFAGGLTLLVRGRRSLG